MCTYSYIYMYHCWHKTYNLVTLVNISESKDYEHTQTTDNKFNNTLTIKTVKKLLHRLLQTGPSNLSKSNEQSKKKKNWSYEQKHGKNVDAFPS